MDPRDSGVIQETAEALLARKDTAGLRCVLLAVSEAAALSTFDQLGAALDCDPEWMTTAGADRLVQQLHELTADESPGVREEARRILSGLRPREQWARDSDDDSL
ncbi:hypothetical protein ACH4MY_10480 [Streptomyces sp. NPDC017246]|uniref:hypothetical protein n=1 Tax=Streptomyces sp. NPDC017246 TaxID=3364985 RepID=UPI0037A949D6